jgi:hypothetical protein
MENKFSKLNIYVIKHILSFFEIKIYIHKKPKSKISLIIGYFDIFKNHGKNSDIFYEWGSNCGGSYKVDLFYLYGKWGNIFKKCFFLFETISICIFRYEKTEIESKILNDLKLIKRFPKSIIKLYLEFEFSEEEYQYINNLLRKFKKSNYEILNEKGWIFIKFSI